MWGIIYGKFCSYWPVNEVSRSALFGGIFHGIISEMISEPMRIKGLRSGWLSKWGIWGVITECQGVVGDITLIKLLSVEGFENSKRAAIYDTKWTIRDTIVIAYTVF